MTRYIVTREYESMEFGFLLLPGDVIEATDLEPDLWNKLIAYGVLVEEGKSLHEFEVEAVAVEVPEPTLEQFTVAELRALADEQGVELEPGLRKAEIIAILEGATNA